MANKNYLYQDIYLYPGTYDRYTNLSKLYGKNGLYFETKHWDYGLQEYSYITEGPYKYTDQIYISTQLYSPADYYYEVSFKLEHNETFSVCSLDNYDKNGNYIADYLNEGTKVSIYCLEEDPSEEPPDLEQLSLVGSYYLSDGETYLYGPTHNDMEEGATYYITFTAEGGAANSLNLKPFIYHEMGGEDYYPGVYPIRFDFSEGYIHCEVSSDYGQVELYKLKSADPEDPETPSASVTASITLNPQTGVATWSYSASSPEISFYEPYVQLWDLNDQIMDPIQIADSSYDFSNDMNSGQTYYAILRVGYYDYNNGTSDEVTARSQEVIYSPSSPDPEEPENPDPEEPEDPTPSTLIYAVYSYYDFSTESGKIFTVYDAPLSNLNSIMYNYGGSLIIPANGDLTGWWFDLGDGNRGKIQVNYADMDGDGIASDLISYNVTLPSGDKFSGGPYSSEGREGWYPTSSSIADWENLRVSIYQDTSKRKSFNAHMLAIADAVRSKASVGGNLSLVNMIDTLNALNSTTGKSEGTYDKTNFDVCMSQLAKVIRTKGGTTAKLTLEKMPAAIAAIQLAPSTNYQWLLYDSQWGKYDLNNLPDYISAPHYDGDCAYCGTTLYFYNSGFYEYCPQCNAYLRFMDGGTQLINPPSGDDGWQYNELWYYMSDWYTQNPVEGATWHAITCSKCGATCYSDSTGAASSCANVDSVGNTCNNWLSWAEGETYGVCHVSLEYYGDYCNYEGPYDLGCEIHGFANWVTRDY